MKCPYCDKNHDIRAACQEYKDSIKPPTQPEDAGLMPEDCQHKRIRQMDWPDNGSVEVCTDCLLTRHHWEQGETEWQDHGYKTVADWYKEAEELERSMRGETDTHFDYAKNQISGWPEWKKKLASRTPSPSHLKEIAELKGLIKECLDCMSENEIPYSDYVKDLHSRIRYFLNTTDKLTQEVKNVNRNKEI